MVANLALGYTGAAATGWYDVHPSPKSNPFQLRVSVDGTYDKDINIEAYSGPESANPRILGTVPPGGGDLVINDPVENIRARATAAFTAGLTADINVITAA